MVLTAEQEAFVRYQQGPAVLHAPVGTGKTLCLAERAAAAIRRGVPACRILCVTFTNLAAEQMRKRVQARCEYATPFEGMTAPPASATDRRSSGGREPG